MGVFFEIGDISYQLLAKALVRSQLLAIIECVVVLSFSKSPFL